MNQTKSVQLFPTEDAAASTILNTVKSYSKKDYYVLYELLNVFTFAELIGFYSRKYPNHDLASVLKSLSDFHEVELEDNTILTPVSWDTIKDKFSKEIRNYILDLRLTKAGANKNIISKKKTIN
jgi:hypothetical protein